MRRRTVVGMTKTAECSIDGCINRAKVRGWCGAHYQRWYKSGDTGPAATRVPPGTRGGVSTSGYRRIHRPDHPLAAANGQVLEHRAVLFDAIGPGEHACHWCGCPVRWDGRTADDRLVVDHLDGDRLNNARENLVPAHQRCNVLRADRPDLVEARRRRCCARA